MIRRYLEDWVEEKERKCIEERTGRKKEDWTEKDWRLYDDCLQARKDHYAE